MPPQRTPAPPPTATIRALDDSTLDHGIAVDEPLAYKNYVSAAADAAARKFLSIKGICADSDPAIITLAYETPGQADHYLNRNAAELTDFIVVLDGIPPVAEKYGFAACPQIPVRLLATDDILIKPQRQPEVLQALENFRYLRDLLEWVPTQLAKCKLLKGENRKAQLSRIENIKSHLLQEFQLAAAALFSRQEEIRYLVPRLMKHTELLGQLAQGHLPSQDFETLHQCTEVLANCLPLKSAQDALETSTTAQQARADQLLDLLSSRETLGRKILVRSTPYLLHDIKRVTEKKDPQAKDPPKISTQSAIGFATLAANELQQEALGTVYSMILTKAQIKLNGSKAPPKVRTGSITMELRNDVSIKEHATTTNTNILLVDFTLFKG